MFNTTRSEETLNMYVTNCYCTYVSIFNVYPFIMGSAKMVKDYVVPMFFILTVIMHDRV